MARLEKLSQEKLSQGQTESPSEEFTALRHAIQHDLIKQDCQKIVTIQQHDLESFSPFFI